MRRTDCVAVVFAGVLGANLVLGTGCPGGAGAGPTTLAEVEVIRPAVTLGGAAVVGRERISAGGELTTAEGGRAWLRHDDTLRLLIDGAVRARVTVDGAELLAGRVFAEASAAAELQAGGVVLQAKNAAFEAVRGGNGVTIVVARGQVAWRAGGERGLVRAGERAELDDKGARVQAAQLWDDWTGGLGWPDAGGGARRGFGEIGARRPGSLGEARFPLSITRLEVRARIEDDEATTRVVQTFFNPASDMLEGLYRVRIPENAILRRFAIDRDGRWADGYVKERETARAQYQAQVYEGSTLDPALLEWEAPGSFRARIYPIPAGATRKILVEYSEWMTPNGPDAERSYRYPMAGGSDTPVLQELDIEVDAAQAKWKSMRAGLSARIEGPKAILAATDYRPTADFVVDLVGPARAAGEARGYRSPHRIAGRLRQGEDDYFLARVLPLPRAAETARVPMDLVILADVSAGTDDTHLQLARTTVEALLRHLNPDDRFAVLGADLELRGPGGKTGKGPAMVAAGRAAMDEALDHLAHEGVGGATDLGAVLTQAAGLLDPARRGAVVYVGDAMPTVGELDLRGLRERLDRLPATLRLYGVAIGDEADLALLESLSEGGGLALRVGDRGAAALAALRILGHAQRRMLERVTVDAGAGLDRVYPRRAVTVIEGEPLELLGRVRAAVPATLTLNGKLGGKPWSATYKVTTQSRGLDDDLRLRWATERLRQLLADGASAEEVAELGTRQNLITPFTSFYVPSAGELSALEPPDLQVKAAGCSMKRSMEAPPAPSYSSPVSVSADAPPPPPTGAASGNRYRQKGDEGKMGRRDSAATVTMKTEPSAADVTVDGKLANNIPVAAPDAPTTPAAQPAPVMKPKESNGLDNLLGGEGGVGLVGSGSGSGGYGSARHAAGGGGTLRAMAPAEKKPAKALASDKKKAYGGKDAFAALVDEEQKEQPSAREAAIPISAGDDDGRDDGTRGLLIQINIYGHRARHCSTAAKLPAADRLSLWKERLTVHHGVDGALEVWQDAQGGCELKSWGDRRALLLAMVQALHAARPLVQLYQRFGDDPGAAEYLRKAILGQVASAADLRLVVDGLGLGEDASWSLTQSLLAKAKTAAERLKVYEQLAQKWPANLRLKLIGVEAFEAVGRLDDARRLATEVRGDPYADAQARTLVGEFLVRNGDEPGARRAFSEIVEFAPKDPQARRRLGDLYRAHGWFEEAYRQYQTLSELLPGDASVMLLLASAAAGAGRVDEALRLEQRVADANEPGSETGAARAARWWSSVRLALLRQAARSKGDEPELARLMGRTRRANVLAEARPFRAFLLWSHPEADCELAATLPGNIQSGPTELAPELGLYGISSREALQGDALLEVRRANATQGLRYEAQLVIIWDEGQKSETVEVVPLKLGPEVPRLLVRATSTHKVEVIK